MSRKWLSSAAARITIVRIAPFPRDSPLLRETAAYATIGSKTVVGLSTACETGNRRDRLAAQGVDAATNA